MNCISNVVLIQYRLGGQREQKLTEDAAEKIELLIGKHQLQQDNLLKVSN